METFLFYILLFLAAAFLVVLVVRTNYLLNKETNRIVELTGRLHVGESKGPTVIPK